MMLGKLVHKFKKQSLQEDQPATVAAVVGSADELATSVKTPPSSSSSATSSSGSLTRGPAFDSGTESDDDELERLGCLNDTSDDDSLEARRDEKSDGKRDGKSAAIGASPPTLTSSPPLISEIDTSSWDSMGCESGIVLRESVERDDSSRDFESNSWEGEPDENSSMAATPVHRQDGFPTNFGRMKSLTDAPPLDFSALRDRNGNGGTPAEKCSGDQSSAEKGGAFRPVVRLRMKKNTEEVSRTSTPSPNNIIGEKRRWADATPAVEVAAGDEAATERVSPLALNNHSPIASRTRGSLSGFSNYTSGTITGSVNNLSTMQDMPRAVLTARRTRVRILYHQGQQQQQPKKKTQPHTSQHHRLSLCVLRSADDEKPPLSQSPPSAPLLANKRGRLSSTSSTLGTPKLIKAGGNERPSLNFDKMRERMMSGENLSTAPY